MRSQRYPFCLEIDEGFSEGSDGGVLRDRLRLPLVNPVAGSDEQTGGPRRTGRLDDPAGSLDPNLHRVLITRWVGGEMDRRRAPVDRRAERAFIQDVPEPRHAAVLSDPFTFRSVPY